MRQGAVETRQGTHPWVYIWIYRDIQKAVRDLIIGNNEYLLSHRSRLFRNGGDERGPEPVGEGLVCTEAAASTAREDGCFHNDIDGIMSLRTVAAAPAPKLVKRVAAKEIDGNFFKYNPLDFFSATLYIRT